MIPSFFAQMLLFSLLMFAFTATFSQKTPSQTLPNLSKLYPKEYPAAIRLLQINKSKIETIFSAYKAEKQFTIAIAFPELLRYNPLQDAMETSANKLLYKNLGSDYSEFSIGAFQMKPSFVEHLEKSILADKAKYKDFIAIATYSVSEEIEVRGERVRRLESWSWQLRYLACFQGIMKNNFAISFENEDEKLRFYATAYNSGYWKTEAQIRKMMKLNVFPKGMSYGTHQQNFSEIALSFYKNAKW
jgi:hypothetical protein